MAMHAVCVCFINMLTISSNARNVLTTHPPAPNPFRRKPVHNILETGVSVIDSMLTCGRGQRLGIFAGAGVGKSTLMGMLARQSDADLTILTLVGERGREVRHFLDDILGEEGLKKSIVLVSTGDTAPILRVRLAFLATALALMRGPARPTCLLCFRERAREGSSVFQNLEQVLGAFRTHGCAVSVLHRETSREDEAKEVLVFSICLKGEGAGDEGGRDSARG